MRIDEFIAANNLTLIVVEVPENPNIDRSDWSKGASHWHCTLERRRPNYHGLPDATMATYFSQGSAHKKPPAIASVLDCLASDASMVESARRFEDWALEFGYDPDSRAAEATYRACVEQTEELRDFLGREAFTQLINDVDRL